MTTSVRSRCVSSLLIAGALVLTPLIVRSGSAQVLAVKDGDKCTKVGLKTRGNSRVTFICARVGTTKVLKWNRVVTKKAAKTTTTQPSVSSTSQVTIQDFAFVVSGNVKSSDVLRVTNRDGSTHTVTSDTGVFDVTVLGNATRSLPSLGAGSYTFFCKIHTSMRGTLVVG